MKPARVSGRDLRRGWACLLRAHETASAASRWRTAVGIAVVSLALLGSPVLAPAAQAADPEDTDQSSLRIGVPGARRRDLRRGPDPRAVHPAPLHELVRRRRAAARRKLTAGLAEAMTGADLEEALGSWRASPSSTTVTTTW